MKKTELPSRSSREPLYGVNPVLEALRGNRKIEEIVLAEGAHHDRLRELIDLARAKNITVSRAPRAALDRAARNASHQGVLARVAAARYADADHLLDSVAARVGTNPEPLVFVRHRINVDFVEGDQAALLDGPPTGTSVVTVGAVELYGSEFFVGH